MIPDPSPDGRGAVICSDCDFKPDKIKNIFKKRMDLIRSASEAMGEDFPAPPNFDIPGFKKPPSILEPKSEMNPYLADVFALVDEDEFAIRDQMIMASSKFMMPLAMGRYRYVYKYAWAIPCKAALEAIASYSPIVEIGAGNGYWASLLHSMGADIVAYDIKPDKFHLSKKSHHWNWFDVQEGDEKTVKKHSDRALFLCWPPYDEDMAYNCAKNYNGETILFVGELNGCTGTEEFFDYLNEHFILEETVELPVWLGLHDALYIYKRNSR